MNPNAPNQPGHPDRPYEDGETDAIRHDQDPFASPPGANSYHGNQHGAAPDLDANAPSLHAHDTQRLNRKALLFLAGIIALLIVAVVWMVSRAASDDDVVAKPREETVTVPALPSDSTTAGIVVGAATETPPIGMADYGTPDMEGMPPLPAESSAQQPAYMPEYGTPPPREPTLRERRMNNMAADEPAAGGVDPYVQAALAGFPGNPANPAGQDKMQVSAEAASAQYINNPDALLVRGTYLRCVLETRIITDVPGFTSCIVTEPIYSINGRSLLVPKGSKIYGKYSNTDPEKPRIAVVWDRITTPNGIDVSMASPGVDGLGSAGYRGDYDAHWASRISSALLISLISDAFKYAGAEYGPTNTSMSNGIITQSPFESNTARTMERLANEALDRTARRPATVTINQGTVVNVYVAKDVDFSGVLARR